MNDTTTDELYGLIALSTVAILTAIALAASIIIFAVGDDPLIGSVMAVLGVLGVSIHHGMTTEGLIRSVWQRVGLLPSLSGGD